MLSFVGLGGLLIEARNTGPGEEGADDLADVVELMKMMCSLDYIVPHKIGEQDAGPSYLEHSQLIVTCEMTLLWGSCFLVTPWSCWLEFDNRQR